MLAHGSRSSFHKQLLNMKRPACPSQEEQSSDSCSEPTPKERKMPDRQPTSSQWEELLQEKKEMKKEARAKRRATSTTDARTSTTSAQAALWPGGAWALQKRPRLSWRSPIRPEERLGKLDKSIAKAASIPPMVAGRESVEPGDAHQINWDNWPVWRSLDGRINHGPIPAGVSGLYLLPPRQRRRREYVWDGAFIRDAPATTATPASPQATPATTPAERKRPAPEMPDGQATGTQAVAEAATDAGEVGAVAGVGDVAAEVGSACSSCFYHKLPCKVTGDGQTHLGLVRRPGSEPGVKL